MLDDYTRPPVCPKCKTDKHMTFVSAISAFVCSRCH